MDKQHSAAGAGARGHEGGGRGGQACGKPWGTGGRRGAGGPSGSAGVETGSKGSGRDDHRWGRAEVPEGLQYPLCHDHGLDHGHGLGLGLGHGEVDCLGQVEGAVDPCLWGKSGRGRGGEKR